MTPDGLFGLLASAPCGAFAVPLDQTIVFWNGGARAVLGYSAGRLVGQKCYEVMAGAADSGLTPDCVGGVRVHALCSGRDGTGPDGHHDAVRVRCSETSKGAADGGVRSR